MFHGILNTLFFFLQNCVLCFIQLTQLLAINILPKNGSVRPLFTQFLEPTLFPSVVAYSFDATQKVRRLPLLNKLFWGFHRLKHVYTHAK